MLTLSVEYLKTPARIKRGLRHVEASQSRAARATEQSPALVSMVLNKKARSEPCLRKLAAFIVAESAKQEENGKVAAA